ncbi:hypothetical protein DL768_011119 [Monosporascus sp. mg162]|nr:hypothetical protein DL768_011119 [Monosporascus sp. mg162]
MGPPSKASYIKRRSGGGGGPGRKKKKVEKLHGPARLLRCRACVRRLVYDYRRVCTHPAGSGSVCYDCLPEDADIRVAVAAFEAAADFESGDEDFEVAGNAALRAFRPFSERLN